MPALAPICWLPRVFSPPLHASQLGKRSRSRVFGVCCAGAPTMPFCFYTWRAGFRIGRALPLGFPLRGLLLEVFILANTATVEI